MQVYTTTTTFSQVTGGAIQPQAITPGFRAKAIIISAAPANGQAFQGTKTAFGWTDLTRKMCDYEYENPANGRRINEKTTQKPLQVWGENAAGNLVVVLEATVNSVSATQVKFDIAVANQNIQVSIMALG